MTEWYRVKFSIRMVEPTKRLAMSVRDFPANPELRPRLRGPRRDRRLDFEVVPVEQRPKRPVPYKGRHR